MTLASYTRGDATITFSRSGSNVLMHIAKGDLATTMEHRKTKGRDVFLDAVGTAYGYGFDGAQGGLGKALANAPLAFSLDGFGEFVLTCAPPCSNDEAVWSSSNEDADLILYFSPPPPDRPDIAKSVHLEGWRWRSTDEKVLMWRNAGLMACTGSPPACRVAMSANYSQSVEPHQLNKDVPGEAAADVEYVDGNGDGLADWVVLAALEQISYYARGLLVEWFNGFSMKDITVADIWAANEFRFLACKSDWEQQ